MGDHLDLKYNEDHAWVRIETEGKATIGISQFAQDSMGEITSVELPELTQSVEKGQYLCSIGSSKAFVDLLSPISGKVAEINEAVVKTPKLVNESPYDQGWLVKLHISRPEELALLMDSKAYEKFTEGDTRYQPMSVGDY